LTLHLHRADRADRLADELAGLLAVPLDDPFSIWLTIAFASLMGIAKPTVDDDWNPLVPAAVLIPITRPRESSSGPPELPRLIAASV